MSRSERGRFLFQQRRYAEAQKELSLALAEDPEDPYPLTLLALSHSEQKQFPQALELARKAIGLNPEYDYAHYVLAAVYLDLENGEQAEKAIKEALELDPFDATYYAALSAALSYQSRWKECLTAAEDGLKLDPEDEACLGMRAHALSILGNSTEAQESAYRAVQQDPESATAHASLGWVALRRGASAEAETHFAESLRLDPNMEWAREGMLESLRHRFPPYRIAFAFFVWLAKFSDKVRWGISIGLYICARLTFAAINLDPSLRVIGIPLLIVYSFIVLVSWVGEPLLNVFLLGDAKGRLALGPRVRNETWIIAAFVAVAVGFGLGAIAKGTLAVPALVATVSVVVVGLVSNADDWPKVRTPLFYGCSALFGVLVGWAAWYAITSPVGSQAFR